MAEFVFTEEQADLRSSVRAFLAATCPEQAVRAWMESGAGYDRAVWARLGGELGVLGLAVPEELGGVGGGLVDQAIVAEELGAAMTPGPVFGTMAQAIPALVALGGDELLEPIVAGARTAALITAGVRAAGEALTGTARHVVDGAADVLLVAADGGLYATEGGTRTPLSTLDQTRRQARVEFAATPARLVAADATAALATARLVGGALLAAEQVGGAQKLLDLTVAYAGTRLQFGRPIGSFQAVKHRCADMFVQVEHARSAAYHAAWALQDVDVDDPELAVSIAQAVCSQAYQDVALAAVQMHGGIGFTWEHSAHLYVKRAFTDAALLGSAAEHRERIAAAVLDGATSTGVPAVAAG